MILAVYRLQLYVTLKISTELKIFQGGQGPPLSPLMCGFFSHRPVATTFSPVVGLCSRPGPTLAPMVCCPPPPLFFASKPEAASFSPVMGTYKSTGVPSGPCGVFRLQAVPLKKVLASCAVPV